MTTLARPAVKADLRRMAGWLDRNDREALGIWALAYVALFVLAWASAWVFRGSTRIRGSLAPWQQWDANWQRNIATHGYLSHASLHDSAAFFPGYPIALAASHFVLRNWAISELAVSAIAGAFVVVMLARMAGARTVLLLVTMPAAVFLLVGYEETLFLAFAIAAWRAAQRGEFWRAGLLAAGSSLVRPEGVILTVALVVMAIPSAKNGAKCLLGFAGAAAYEAYLWIATGNLWAWSHAQQAGWDMHTVSPWKSTQTTWWTAFEHPYDDNYSFAFQVQMIAMAVIVAFAIWFLVKRMWPEAVLCAGVVAVTITSTWWESETRSLLLLFPIVVVVAWWPKWARSAWIGVSGTLAVVFALLFMAGQWAG